MEEVDTANQRYEKGREKAEQGDRHLSQCPAIDSIVQWSLINSCSCEGFDFAFLEVWSDRTVSNGFKQTESRVRLDIRKKLLPVRAVKPWHRLPREAVDVPSLEVSKARLDGI
ncbi:hypothetical protein DUI87_04724 [Hirundo rustica rustica]|uniref:Uncharacterized protein n=1 Tax=Hirundo rustica rustica TaxID=333673 RepID=A0A3M0KZX6_HIRRU|nr:hypothetical protein DUI87_04724 [Hirundo rustica rustica]